MDGKIRKYNPDIKRTWVPNRQCPFHVHKLDLVAGERLRHEPIIGLINTLPEPRHRDQSTKPRLWCVSNTRTQAAHQLQPAVQSRQPNTVGCRQEDRTAIALIFNVSFCFSLIQTSSSGSFSGLSKNHSSNPFE